MNRRERRAVEIRYDLMVNKGDHVERLAKAIHDIHGAAAIHLGSEPIMERIQGRVAWQGEVEVFTITGHPEARICYAWTYQDGSTEHVAVVLGIPPIRTELDAVRSFVVSQVKKHQAN